ncbi:uncharacterized protein LOC110466952 [Mizuhopecten yessoensis]|uniref:Cadherin domain-containing protein n=1 Tax=Mizuhopecten yessoensis TaxID=6573 RepID=A0A210PN38_MIZYE|nr:uncharacterized protein LOC110466952 [Mizuhopecten yessoensis]OWF37891.1 hypothetical protein KP79_PYT05545 [Mizuhopecten yessoensis]
MGDHQYKLLVVLLVHYVLRPSMVTSTTCSSRCASTAHHVVHTCPDALAQIIPTCVYETDPAGTCLLSLITDSSLIFDVSIINPPEFVNRLGGYFQFNRNNATQILLELQHPLDVETVYLNTNITTMDIQLTVSCTNDSQTMESVTLNLTAVDDDDNGPSFSQTADSTCLLPAFTASAHEEYIGPLTTHPSGMFVTDGDFVTNNDIVLSFLHGNPPDFSKFFAVDMLTNTINKTSNMSSGDPRDYTFIIQAKEKSAVGRSMVAVLSVGIESGYPAVTMREHKADESVKLVLQVLSATVLVGFSIGFVILIWHRNRRVKPATKQEDTKQSVIECLKSNIIDEAHDAESKFPCAKRTEWTLESIDEEPEQM